MANKKHLDLLRQGIFVWNHWLETHPGMQPDLSEADLGKTDLSRANLSGADFFRADLRWANLAEANLSGASLTHADFTGANLTGANLSGADIIRTDLTEAHLSGADLSGADLGGVHLGGVHLSHADLSRADLSGADLGGAYLSDTDLTGANLLGTHLGGADLTGANLTGANLSEADLTEVDARDAILDRCLLVETNLEKSNLTGCSVYGISAWNLRLRGAIQANLTISRSDEPAITVDNLEVAQFIYLLLNNEKIRDVIDTLGRKAILILGRFSAPRKQVLDALREALRQKGYVPIVFDFERPTSKDFTETIKTLAGLCLFVIADITNPRSSPLELQATVPDYMIPFIPICQDGEPPFAMFQDLQQQYDWVADVITYDSVENLLKGLDVAIIDPALAIHDRLLARKALGLRSRHIQEILSGQ